MFPGETNNLRRKGAAQHEMFLPPPGYDVGDGNGMVEEEQASLRRGLYRVRGQGKRSLGVYLHMVLGALCMVILELASHQLTTHSTTASMFHSFYKRGIRGLGRYINGEGKRTT